ncbi:MAG: HAMP domain-containing histidine kinase [Clostridia bacterium]|nr:HAMP domain-containing histidine kinase [Clostridia bacterium]
MSKKKLRSAADNSAFSIVIIGLTIVIVGCFLGIRYLMDYYFYDAGNNGETAKSVAVQIYSVDDCEKVKDYYKCLKKTSDVKKVKYYQELFDEKRSNFVFTVTDESGAMYLENVMQSRYSYSYSWVEENAYYSGEEAFFDVDENGNTQPMILRYSIILEDGNVANDRYKSAFDWIEIANSLKFFVFAVLFACLIILIILLCIITINAGVTDPETGEIIPSSVDKIPLDLCTIAVIGFFAVAWMVMGLTTAADVEMVLNNLVVVITFVAFIMLLMSYLQTVSVRVKMGKIYKNTIFYMIYRKFKRKTPRKVRRVFGEMSFFKKLLLGITAYIIFEASILGILAGLIFFTENDLTKVFTMFLIVWGMTRLIIIPIFVMVAINLNYIKEEGERLAGGILDSGVTDKLSIAAFKSHGKNLDQIRKEINKAMEQELKSEKLRNELITNVSHDIKTPLTSIKSYVDFLQRDNLSEKERKEYLEIVAKHTDKLAVLAKNLIEVSQITSGNVEVKREKTSLNIIVEQTIEEFALKLEQSELMPRIRMPENDVYIMGDGEWLWRIFSNLLNNACKYAASGTDVEISLEENNGKAAVRIANISKSALRVEGDELFERFVRGDSSRHTEGNGLGLSIAKSLAELQGGTLDISVKGDTFMAVVVFDTINNE